MRIRKVRMLQREWGRGEAVERYDVRRNSRRSRRETRPLHPGAEVATVPDVRRCAEWTETTMPVDLCPAIPERMGVWKPAGRLHTIYLG
jgi:hypothetical protein